MSDPVAAPAAAPAAPASADKASSIAPKAGVRSNVLDSTKTAAPAATEPQKTVDEKITVKINGKLRTMSRDEAVRELQKGFASRENFEKASKMTQNTQQLLRALKDPNIERRIAALKQLEVDPDEIAEHRLQSRAKQAQMTPEQARIAELEADIQRRDAEAKDFTERQEQEFSERQDREIWAKTEGEYIAEIDKAVQAGQFSGVSPAEALYLMADAGIMNLEYGLDLPAAELVAEAKSKIDEARSGLQSKILAATSEDEILELLGPEAVRKVAAAAVKKFKGGQPIQTLQKPATIADPEAKPEPKKWLRPGAIKTSFL